MTRKASSAKKLVLNKRSVRTLSNDSLAKVNGGITLTTCGGGDDPPPPVSDGCGGGGGGGSIVVDPLSNAVVCGSRTKQTGVAG